MASSELHCQSNYSIDLTSVQRDQIPVSPGGQRSRETQRDRGTLRFTLFGGLWVELERVPPFKSPTRFPLKATRPEIPGGVL